MKKEQKPPKSLTLIILLLIAIGSEKTAWALNLNNRTLVLAGTCTMQINASLSAASAVQNISTVKYGGTLIVSNVAGMLTGGETFALFSARSYKGSFSAVILPALPATLQWNTASLSVNGTISVVQSPWGQWSSLNFTPTQLADPNTSGPAAVPNGDGIPNLLKYTLGLDAWSFAPLPIAYDIEAVGGGDYLRLTVYKNQSATDVTYTVEGTDDLSDGNWSAAETTIELNTSTTLKVRDNVPMNSASKGFLRLNVTQP